MAFLAITIESNLSWISADGLANEMSQSKYYPLYIHSADPKGERRVGVWTGEVEKQLYAEELKRSLHGGTLEFAEDEQMIPCFSQDAGKRKTGEPPTKQKKMFFNQLLQFRKVTHIPKDYFGKPKVTYTGKQAGQPDDLVLATQINLYHSIKLRNNDTFLAYCRKHNFLP